MSEQPYFVVLPAIRRKERFERRMAQVHVAPLLERMSNRRMARKLKDGKCIDVSLCERTADGDYVLGNFYEGTDYCDAEHEAWIWSVGKLLTKTKVKMANGRFVSLPGGTFLASTSNKFYSAGESAAVECVFLR